MKFYIVDFEGNDCATFIHLDLEAAKIFGHNLALGWKNLRDVYIYEVTQCTNTTPKFTQKGKYLDANQPGIWRRLWNYDHETGQFDPAGPEDEDEDPEPT